MSERERSRSPERDDGAAPASAPTDGYHGSAADHDTNGGAAGGHGGPTEDPVKLYVGNLDYGKARIGFRPRTHLTPIEPIYQLTCLSIIHYSHG